MNGRDGGAGGKEPAAAAALFSLLRRPARGEACGVGGRRRPCPPREVLPPRPRQGRDEGLTPGSPLGGPRSRRGGLRGHLPARWRRPRRGLSGRPGEMRVFSASAARLPRRGRLVPAGVVCCRPPWRAGRQKCGVIASREQV